MKRIYCVQPYCVRRHKLAASGATVFAERDAAVAAGSNLARSRAGIVVLSQDIDARSGLMGKPQVIAIHGRVPDNWCSLDQASKAA